MRLWHKDLISVLPQKQLISQWRELCCISKNIKEKGTPNHILVNKILNYEESHFIAYTKLVINEFHIRNYKISQISFNNYLYNLNISKQKFDKINIEFVCIYKDWHNKRYLKQCFYNLQEKYDNGGISEKDYKKICETLQLYKCNKLPLP